MKKIKIDFSNLPFVSNKCYHKYFNDYRRFQIFKGGAGAGKSVFVSQKIIFNMIINKTYNVLILRKIGRDNHDSTFAEIQKTINSFGMNELFTINHTRGAEEIVCKLTENKAIFRGLDDVEKIKSVTFKTGDLIAIWGEEASEYTREDFEQLNLRLRGKSKIPKHIILSFNPIDIDSWLKEYFFDNKLDKEKGFICETIYKDNKFLDDEYKGQLESYKEKDLYYYNVYCLNQWGSRATSRIFHNIKIHDFNIIEHNYENIRYGMDFGYNHANTLIGCGQKDGELYIFKEWYAKNQLNKDFIKTIESSTFEKDYSIMADSANPDKIQEWNNAGFLCYGAKKGKDSLRIGINYLKELPCIHIHATNCPNAAREFPRFKYRELKDGQILDEPVEIDDDTIAAVRYSQEEFFNLDVSGHYFIRKRSA